MGLFMFFAMNFFTMLSALVLPANHSHISFLPRHIPRYLPLDILSYYDDAAAETSHDALVKGAQEGAEPVQKFDFARCHRSDSAECLNSGKESVFEAATVSFPVPGEHLRNIPASDGAAYSITSINRCELLAGEVCVAYATGLAGGSEFEDTVANMGCELHAFDCSVDEQKFGGKRFKFHPWCIGAGSSGANGTHGQYKTLQETARDLRHPRIDMLKMDVEGLEYQVVEDVLKGPMLPLQLVLALHTEEAASRMAPEADTRGRGYNEVSALFSKMFDQGYRIISKHINEQDRACAEFGVLNVNQLKQMGAGQGPVKEQIPC